jgi:copper chaperone CopZ
VVDTVPERTGVTVAYDPAIVGPERLAGAVSATGYRATVTPAGR